METPSDEEDELFSKYLSRRSQAVKLEKEKSS